MSQRLHAAARLGAAAVAAGVAAALFAGCATPPLPPVAADAPRSSGRLAVQVEATAEAPARDMTAAFDLRGDARAGQLDLSTPLGTMLAQASWSTGGAVLATPQGRTRYADLGALMQDAVGADVPVAALMSWLLGRPWPQAPHASTAEGFEQLGWKVDLTRFADGAVSAKRAGPPAVTVRAKLERP